ncbi:MAG: ERCC4 domain-containing protein [Romboutsia timonensis]|uniref:ERCC4 domain-containing protein n=1 Tax=Romboutsia timonensis TaxID=1776391 RepID=UPI00205E0BF6|nr:MAG TPA: ERCC4 domain protein [Caudoviricetes sp.]
MDFTYKILVDSREKENKHIVDKFKTNNIDIDNIGLVIGDYRIQSGTYIPPITIERKGSLDELIGNLLDKDKDNEGNNRFIRELNRARDSQTRIILLIEDKDFYVKLLTGDYRSNVNPKAIRGMVMSLEAKYPNLSIVGVDKSTSASYIHTTLYYYLRQKMKEVKQYG